MSVIYDNLKNRTALVTGGSKGIGRAACLMLANNGVSVIVQYNKSADSANEVVKTIMANGGKAFAIRANLGSSESVRKLVADSNEKLDHIDILLNNAGEMTHANVEELGDDQWDHAIRLHLTSVFELTRALIPGMKLRRHGRIINIASQVIFTGSGKHAHYSAAKSGLIGFTYSLVKELGDSGVTANMISPGRIKTDMIIPHIPDRKDEWLKQTPMKRFGEPEEVANLITFLASGESSYITGANININGGQVMG